MSTVANWGANFPVAATFLSLGGAITTEGTFYLYAGIAVAAFMFFRAKVPGTRDRTLGQIQHELTDGGQHCPPHAAATAPGTQKDKS
ncbi:MAG: MFS transporter [Actinomycetota bacterium]|nr:MFS transporter [Actinomycetota bacterium]